MTEDDDYWKSKLALPEPMTRQEEIATVVKLINELKNSEDELQRARDDLQIMREDRDMYRNRCLEVVKQNDQIAAELEALREGCEKNNDPAA